MTVRPDDVDHGGTIRLLLNRAVHACESLLDMGPEELDMTLRLLRQVKLLGRVGVRLESMGLLDQLPPVARDQVLSAMVLARSRARVAFWELDRIAWAMKDLSGIPLIAMKGCAYLLLDLPIADGRIFADVDLMVPESELSDVERHLNARGWMTRELTAYDDRYYRRWTHELPPLMHVERDVEIDLHHNILARTARLKPPAEKLLQSTRKIAGSRYLVLSDEDIVLHAVAHLMFDSDLSGKYRDLVDIAGLLGHFAAQADEFWDRLVDRAEDMNLGRPTYYALRYARTVADHPVPDSVLERAAAWAPPAPVRRIMDGLVTEAILPLHPERPSRAAALRRFLLYVRSHWIKMPPWLLAYHLSSKFVMRRRGKAR